MFTAAELASMAATVAATLGPDSGLGAEIVIYRGDSDGLLPQPVRLVRPSGQSQARATDGTEAEQVDVYVVGLPGLDIRPRDRFSLDGNAYEVMTVHPQRQIDTVAAARLVQ